ncbi:SRPBCC domain-containing protein [Photobacterium galatheae]|uniref:SRPBCC domain-containing protein n=1 Tax=Photobacterium galatheae TaxID=1654360 RepID=UPI00202CAE5E|nr:SRPBCC domain-containing protein [Photobacterium galatheae]MCM0147289.1 SRPBCC domain-containing protein [Photobacterium galatheae]
MSLQHFKYVSYIAAKDTEVWNALLDPKMTQQYWGHVNESDWKVGSRWAHIRADGSEIEDVTGKVLLIHPPHHLVLSWQDADSHPHATHSSQVSLALESLGTDTRLTVIHSDLQSGSLSYQDVSEGWPAVISNLKTLLETGKVMDNDIWAAN